MNTLIERIDAVMERYKPLDQRQELAPSKTTPSHGSVSDIQNNARADYTNYRKIHFSKAKCPKECPYCNKARQRRVVKEAKVFNLAVEKAKKSIKNASSPRAAKRAVERAIEQSIEKELGRWVNEVGVSIGRYGNENGIGGVAYVIKKKDVSKVKALLKNLGFTKFDNEGYDEDVDAYVLQFDMLDVF